MILHNQRTEAQISDEAASSKRLTATELYFGGLLLDELESSTLLACWPRHDECHQTVPHLPMLALTTIEMYKTLLGHRGQTINGDKTRPIVGMSLSIRKRFRLENFVVFPMSQLRHYKIGPSSFDNK